MQGGTQNSAAIEPLIGATVAIRLLQVHMCIIYFFSGIGKAQGELWWNGLAMFMATANLEYQSVSATWLVHYRYLAFFLTHLIVFWELSYCCLSGRGSRDRLSSRWASACIWASVCSWACGPSAWP